MYRGYRNKNVHRFPNFASSKIFVGIPVLGLNGHSFGLREMTNIWPDILF